MSSELEGAADAATGAVLARAVEPTAGESAGRSAPVCLNCSTPLTAAYCGACGQKARVHRTLGAFAHDALHSVLHFDGKLWRTLPLLVWHPGRLTRRYVHGERARFVSPLALFLFCVLLAYALLGLMLPAGGGLDRATAAEIEVKERERSTRIAAELQQLEQQRAAAGADAARVAAIDAELASKRSQLIEGATRLRRVQAAEARVTTEKARIHAAVASANARLEEARAEGAPTHAIEDELALEEFAGRLMAQADELLTTTSLSGVARVSIPIGSERLIFMSGDDIQNPQLQLHRLQTNAYKFAWALVPISVPFVWLLFLSRREFELFDHAVFVTYSLCFMLLLATATALMGRIPALAMAAALVMALAPPLHMYRHVRHAYSLSRWAAVWRTALLLGFAFAVIALFSSLLIALGVRT
jgi:hypothetical protein